MLRYLVLPLSLVALLLCPLFGTSSLNTEVLSNPFGLTPDHTIFWSLRVPRVVLAALTGASLTLGGIVFQALFRNALATPYTLGVSSGAAFGAACSLHVPALGVFTSMTSFALLGASFETLCVYLLAFSFRRLSATGILLTGVIMSFFFGSLVLFLQYLGDLGQVFQLSRWLMGSLDTVGYDDSVFLAGFFFIVLFSTFIFHQELDLLLLGDEYAQSKGVSVTKIQILLFALVSLLIAACVATVGPIGFVGIIVPHITRSLVGQRHKLLIPYGMLLGAVFVALSDLLARTLIPPAEIPVGLVTGIAGGPFFLWVFLMRGSR